MGPKNLYLGKKVAQIADIRGKMHRNRLKLCLNEYSKFTAIYSFHTTVAHWDEDKDNKHEHVVPREPLEWG